MKNVAAGFGFYEVGAGRKSGVFAYLVRLFGGVSLVAIAFDER